MGLFNFKKKTVLDDNSGLEILGQSKGLRVSEEAWGSGSFLDAYKNVLYVNKALEVRKSKVGDIEFILKRKDKQIEEDPILELLNRPSTIYSGCQFYGMWQLYKDIFGEVFVLLQKNKELFSKDSKISSMVLLYPPSCKPTFDDFGNLQKVEYKQKGGKDIKYEAQDIIYDFRPDPENPLRGVSLLQAGAKSISVSRQIDESQVSLLRNGGRVDGIISFKTVGVLTKEQRSNLKKDYNENYSEAVKSGTPLFLGGDSDYKRVALSPSEMGFMDSKKMSLNDVCILTQVPKILLASTDDIQYANSDTAMRMFLREVIKPEQNQIIDKLWNKLKLIDPTISLSCVDQTPDDIDQKIKVVQAGITSYFMSPNEARESFGLDPVDGGDEILAPFSIAPLSQITEEPEPVVIEPTPPVIPVVPVEEKPEPIVEEPRTEENPKEPEVKRLANNPFKSHTFRRQYFEQEIKKADNNEKAFKFALRQYLSGQKKRMIADLKDQNLKAFKKKDLISEMFNIDYEITIGLKEMLPILNKIAQKAGWDAMELAGGGKFTYTSNLDARLAKRAEFFLGEINKTTFKKLTKVLANNITEGGDRPTLIKDIEETFDGITKGRAKTIARTEVHTAMNEGTNEGYKQSGLTLKTWVAVLDSATRDSHAEIDGEERPLDMPFSNGLMYPGSPDGPPEEVINCRCVI